jgi:hypothetical protein
MSAAEASIAADILGPAIKLGTAIYDGIQSVIAGHRPDLLPSPPPREDGHIVAEDASVIAARFGLQHPAAGSVSPPDTTPTGQPPTS